MSEFFLLASDNTISFLTAEQGFRRKREPHDAARRDLDNEHADDGAAVRTMADRFAASQCGDGSAREAGWEGAER